MAITRGEIVRAETLEGDRSIEDRLYRALRPWFWLTPESRRQRLAVRTRFIDREVIEALDAGMAQVVIIGAGYDCRAMRLRKAGTRFFEVDHPATQEDKRGRLAALGTPLDDTVYVPIDLTNTALETSLDRAGHRRHERTLFICEGLLLYLSVPAIRGLLHAVSMCAAPESRLVLTARAKSSQPRRQRSWLPRLALATIGEPARSSFARSDLLHVLKEHDFAPTRELAWPAEDDRRQTLMISAEAARGHRRVTRLERGDE